MPTELIPLANLQESGGEELSGASPSAMNVVTDKRGCVRRRPGIAAYSEAPSGVVDADGIYGMYTTDEGDLFAVGGSSPAAQIYRVAGGSAAALSPGLIYTEMLTGSGRPVFAETEMLLVITAGLYIQKVELSSFASSRLGGPPPQATHVIAQNLRLSANDVAVDKTKVNYSNIAIGTTDFSGHEEWPTPAGVDGGYFTAESRPDDVVALGENTNEVFVWGSRTLQVFSPDPTLVYAPVATKEAGCSAPYSPINADENFAWLNDKRRFVLSDGRSIDQIGGDAVARDLKGMAQVDDCFGYRVLLETCDALVWTFPADGRTYVYQQGVGWGQWASRVGGAWGPFPVTAHHLQVGTGNNLVGTADGRIGELSFDSSTDFDEPISAHVTTGFIDRGTTKNKLCSAVRLTLRRGETSSGEPRGLLSWRNNLGGWEAPIWVSLGRSGDFETTVTLPSLGVYRTRQWRFQFDSEATLVLVKVEEDFEILEG